MTTLSFIILVSSIVASNSVSATLTRRTCVSHYYVSFHIPLS